jgi:hypothetical protein
MSQAESGEKTKKQEPDFSAGTTHLREILKVGPTVGLRMGGRKL